jgi:hypothetical protein
MMDTHQKYLEGGEIIYAPKVDSLVFHNGKGRAQVWFWLLESPNVRSVDIFWNSYADSLSVPVTPSTGRDSLMAYVPLTEERSYTVYVRTTDIFGNHSLSEMGSATSYGAIYESTLANRGVKSAETVGSTIEIQWYGIADGYVYSEVRYTGVNGEVQTIRVLPNETSTSCPNAKAGSAYEHRSLYVPTNSIDTFYMEWTPITVSRAPVKLDKTGWTVETSDEQTSDGGGKDMIIDGDYSDSRYWQSSWGPEVALPHWLIIDMKESREVTRIITLRRNIGDTKTLQYFMGDSPDVNAGTWVKVVEGSYGSSGGDHTITLDIAAPVSGRYLKLVMIDSYRVPYTSICEIDVYGYDDAIIIPDDILRSAKASWQFDDPSDITKASAGSPLIRQGEGFTFVEGPKASNGAVQVAKGSYFRAPHGIAANGGGSRVNNFSVMFDFKVSELGRYYSFIQTTLENNDDAEFFLRPAGNLGIGGTGYSEHVVTAGEWHRLVISAAMGNAYLYYIDGKLIHTGNTSNATVDSRFSWLPEGVLFFADEDGEDADMDISNIAVWDKALSTSEVAALGGVE